MTDSDIDIIKSQREEAMKMLLRATGFQEASVDMLDGDASFRRYGRLIGGPKPALLMDAPPESENLRAYIEVSHALERLRLRVPKVFGSNENYGFAIIEDFGDNTYTKLLEAGASELELYLLATDVLKALHAQKAAGEVGLKPYDMNALLAEIALFVDWYVPWLLDRPLSSADRDRFLKAWQDVLVNVASKRETLVLRDYHVDNLMKVAGADGVGACGLLDFQDALIGARGYDIASLIEDARRDVSPEVKSQVLEHYFSGMDKVEREKIETDIHLLAAQRHTKVLGIFVRLYKRDGKPGYLCHLPRLIDLLKSHLKHDDLRPVATVMADICPDWDKLDMDLINLH